MLSCPDGVLAYFTDPQVRAGVDAMMARPDKLPRDLQWSEMPAYFRALSAAQRVVVDHALLLQDAWQAAWEPLIPSSWTAIDPDDQVADWQCSPHPRSCWESGSFARCFNSGLRTIQVGISLNEGGLFVNFGVFRLRTGSVVLRRPVSGFEYDEDEGILSDETPLPIPADGSVAIGRLVARCVEALAVIAGTERAS